MDFQAGTLRGLRPPSHRRDPGRLPDRVKIEKLLRVKGAPAACWLVSERSGWDGGQLPLADALEAVVGAGFGTVISCIPGRLGYFEGELPRSRRTAASSRTS